MQRSIYCGLVQWAWWGAIYVVGYCGVFQWGTGKKGKTLGWYIIFFSKLKNKQFKFNLGPFQAEWYCGTVVLWLAEQWLCSRSAVSGAWLCCSEVKCCAAVCCCAVRRVATSTIAVQWLCSCTVVPAAVKHWSEVKCCSEAAVKLLCSSGSCNQHNLLL